MSNKFIIECPNCKVRFFVTDELLATANGALRCGFCSDVFNGNDFIVYQTLNTQPKTITTQDPKSDSSHENISIQKTNTIEAIKTENSANYWDEVVNTLSNFSVDFKLKDQTIPEETKPSFIEEQQIASINNQMLYNEKTYCIDTDILEQIERTNFDQLLQLDEQELLAKQTKDITPILTNKTMTEEISDQRTEPNSKINPKNITPPVHTTEDDIPKDIYGNTLKKVSDLDFMTENPPANKVNRHTFLWSVLSLLAALILAGQYMRFIAPEIAKTDSNREWAKEVCSLLMCNIPEPVDVNKIQTSQLLVASSPQYQNILNVNAVINNKLEISQPFPIIELRFTNLNNQTVASRRFLPNEYLTKEVLKNNQMPPNIPFHISFEIFDPGETATGYSFFYYPDK